MRIAFRSKTHNRVDSQTAQNSMNEQNKKKKMNEQIQTLNAENREPTRKKY